MDRKMAPIHFLVPLSNNNGTQNGVAPFRAHNRPLNARLNMRCTLEIGVADGEEKRKPRSVQSGAVRHPLIAKAFYLRGVIERWGRGTQKIVELCVKAGHPEPEFGEQAGSVWVRFLPSGYIAPHRVAHDLTERQRELLQILANHGSLPLREIRKCLSAPPSDRMIQEDLAHLRRLELVESTGRGRGAAYRLRKTHE